MISQKNKMAPRLGPSRDHVGSLLEKLRPNPEWATLPLFDRTGWRSLPFGAFAESINERVKPSEAANEIYVGLDDIDPENLHISRWGKGGDVIGTKLRFRKGDLIFGRRRAYQRKLAVAEMDGICSAHAMVVRAKKDILPEFLPFLMMSDRFMSKAAEISVGSLSPTINWKTLSKVNFDIPPLDQQQRIADLLWAFDGYGTKAVGFKKANGRARDDYFKTKFFGGDRSLKTEFPQLENYRTSPGWSLLKAADLVESPITKGATPSNHLNTDIATIPFIKVYNLTFEGVLDFSVDPTYLEESIHKSELKRSQVFPGDILMNIVGPPMGKLGLVPATIPEANINQAITVYRIKDVKKRIYFLEYLKSDIAQSWFDRHSKKTSGQKNLTLETAQNLPVSLPPEKELAALVAILASFEKTELYLKSNLEKMKLLMKAILNRIF